MAKERSGYVFEEQNRWYARITFTDESGKRRNIKRRAENRTEAKLLLKKLLRELEDNGSKSIEISKLTFNDLADYYSEHYLHPAEYVNDRKVTGLRDWKHVRCYLKIFRGFFGNYKLRDLTYEHIRAFRASRLKTPTQYNRQRSLTTVNRELSCLRRLLHIAEREMWVQRNPFKTGDSLICSSDERKRDRILTREEEIRLLTACESPRRIHLRPIIICALDTGMRRGEMFKLRWRDIDLETRTITIQAFNTKTLKCRQVSITIRLIQEFKKLWDISSRDSNDLVFGISDVKKAFTSVRREAGLEDVRFHDLRHTHATRLDDLGFSLAKIGGQLGHTQLQTTLRYVNRDKSSIKQVANALDAFNSESSIEQAMELVN